MTDPEVIVFYAGGVHWEFDNDQEYVRHRRYSLIDSEIYNGAFVYFRKEAQGTQWYRMDGTPVLLSDVPHALRAWTLIL
jgi:hypothetical protein